MLLVCAIAGVAVAIAMTPAPAPAGKPSVSGARLLAYEAAITPTLQAAGSMVEQEIKPSIASLQGGTLAVAQVRERAAGWSARFAQARAALAKVTVPREFAGAAALFDRAFVEYEAAVAPLGALIEGARADAVTAAIDAASAAARKADAVYDQAAAIIQAQRRALGMGPTIDLPDPTATP